MNFDLARFTYARVPSLKSAHPQKLREFFHFYFFAPPFIFLKGGASRKFIKVVFRVVAFRTAYPYTSEGKKSTHIRIYFGVKLNREAFGAKTWSRRVIEVWNRLSRYWILIPGRIYWESRRYRRARREILIDFLFQKLWRPEAFLIRGWAIA